MKKFGLLLFLLFLSVALTSVFAQEAPKADLAKPAEKEEVTKKKETSAFEMGEIVVKDRSIANIEDAGTTMEIEGKDIRARSDKTLGDALSLVPGVNVYTSRKGGTRFNIRGFDQDRVAILIDGIPINDVYESSVDISQIPVMNVSKIVVNKGVSSALYGANSAMGVVNVITQKPEKLFAEANAEYGQYNNYYMNVANGAPIGNFYYWITATYMNSDGYKPSKKLDSAERRKWFDKFVRYDLYGKTYEDFYNNLKAVRTYIDEDGKWGHTEYQKYQVAGKLGYNITEKTEVGVSSSYFHNKQRASSYTANFFISYDDQTMKWSDPNFSGNKNVLKDGRNGAFVNRAFYWPEKIDFMVSPYFRGQWGDLTLKTSLHYVLQKTNLEGYIDQDNTYGLFPPSISTFMTPWATDPYVSTWTEESVGFKALPSYKIAKWNKLSMAFMYRRDTHKEEEEAVSAEKSPNVYAVHGDSKYTVKEMSADFLTLAVEDEMKLLDVLNITAGISYDAQNFREFKNRDSNSSYELTDRYVAKDRSTIWGTRDSFNPVFGIVYDAIKDLLKVRSAFSAKTKFPTLAAYKDITDDAKDDSTKIKPERSYNANLGYDLMFFDSALVWRTDGFYTKFKDKIESVFIAELADKYYTNADKVEVAGAETSLSVKTDKIANLFDMMVTASYCYSKEKVDDSSTVYKGDRFEDTPRHTYILDFKMTFVSKTALNFWGQYTRNQIRYTQGSRPQTTVDEPYSTQYYKAVQLHNPLMLNIKISQKFMENFEVYGMCKNIMDDYNADPFNPGPGRMFYFGGSAKL